MRFTAQDVANLLRAFEVLADEESHRHMRNWAMETVTHLGPRVIDAYCTAVGLELPVS